ncbi:glutathione S-transferase family protein [Luteimonas fraxinea]|uniref:Glutathione S-transferase family protein n=1 Tax=Luteimonas fraxinea TaxID=2901869 RepID=A0ABS8UC98_9GAMM|nr:glutathione S-transferase family protein [Luteimonas fraxinea]MCD9096864.1 glutathione S-transferase family protein [Luteimonas fraxinea]UHH09790.1 glutathione S-transferase family protein [Luteimonas fraxinea]
MTAVYGYSPSGNCHKVRLLLEQMDRPYTWIETDSSRGETRTPGYLAKNPNGQVPMLELDDGRVLVESNAILCFLAAGTPLLPSDPWQHAQALRWMFFEQYSHEPAIAVARFIRGWTEADSPRRAELPALQARGHRALVVMDGHLSAGAAWFSGNAYGVADIALFAYTAVAPDGGFDLAPYPALRDWLARVRGTPGFIDMPAPAPVNAARLAATD